MHPRLKATRSRPRAPSTDTRPSPLQPAAASAPTADDAPQGELQSLRRRLRTGEPTAELPPAPAAELPPAATELPPAQAADTADAVAATQLGPHSLRLKLATTSFMDAKRRQSTQTDAPEREPEARAPVARGAKFAAARHMMSEVRAVRIERSGGDADRDEEQRANVGPRRGREAEQGLPQPGIEPGAEEGGPPASGRGGVDSESHVPCNLTCGAGEDAPGANVPEQHATLQVPERSAAEAAAAVAALPPALMRVRVALSFVPNSSTEPSDPPDRLLIMALSVGELIDVTSQEPGAGWWSGRKILVCC